jgi:hypothetical protein
MRVKVKGALLILSKYDPFKRAPGPRLVVVSQKHRLTDNGDDDDDVVVDDDDDNNNNNINNTPVIGWSQLSRLSDSPRAAPACSWTVAARPPAHQ